MQYLFAFCNRPEAASGDERTNISKPIAQGGSVLRAFRLKIILIAPSPQSNESRSLHFIVQSYLDIFKFLLSDMISFVKAFMSDKRVRAHAGWPFDSSK